jgi:predicted aldo/keto reductase-like oxidoreductase
MRRRDFLGAAVAGGIGITGLATRRASAENKREPQSYVPKSNAPRIPQREYGKTGVKLSIVGFPGFAMRDTTEKEQSQVDRLVAESIEHGVNLFDVAADYGNAEVVVGPALAPYRKDVYISSKTAKRTAAESAAELKRTLARMKTDHLDVYNLHHISSMQEVDTAFGKGGAMETLTQAKRDGRVRHLGFSAHSIEAATAALDRYDFDSAIFPINFASMTKGRWGPQIIEKCKAKGVAMFALKPMARQKWPENDPKRGVYPICWYQPTTDLDEAELALRYTLTQPVVAALPPSSDRLYRLSMLLAMDYRPLTEAELMKAAQLAEGLNPVFTL